MKKGKISIPKIIFSFFKKILLFLFIFILVIFAFLYYSAGNLIQFLPIGYGAIAGENNYLIIFQNDAELRPTGGFINSYGVLKIENGVIKDFKIDDSYNFPQANEKIEPPEPLGKMLESPSYPGFVFRDANFYPNFKKSALEILNFFYDKNPNTKIKGVIAINFSVIEDLFGKIGEIELENKKYNEDNIFYELEFAVQNIDHHNWQEIQKRKEIIKKIGKEIAKSILENPLKYRDISNLFAESLDKKEIQIYFTDSNMQNFIRKKGWGGVFERGYERDFLGIVATNLGGGKSNRYIHRDIVYKIQRQDKRNLNVSLKIAINHLGTFNEPISTKYKEYLRIFVPETAVFRNKVVFPSEGECGHSIGNFVDGDFRVFDACLEVDPGNELEIRFDYEIPNAVLKNGDYSLYIPKQSGTQNNLKVFFRAENDNLIKSDSLENHENVALYSGVQNKDLLLSLNVGEDKTPPRAMYQKFVSLNEIEFRVNEELEEDSLLNLDNYKFYDLDERVLQITDKPIIKEIRYEFPFVRLVLDGVSYQNEERFILEIKNVTDKSGNKFDPNPKRITFIQRNIE